MLRRPAADAGRLLQLDPQGRWLGAGLGPGGDLTFPTLYDADGDGLSRTDDPDDSKWDADGDGLSDVYELNTGSSPLCADTDDDGLTDLQEARFGSDPASQDGDGDGLLRLPGGVPPGRGRRATSNARKVCGEWWAPGPAAGRSSTAWTAAQP